MPTDYQINLAKGLVSEPGERKRFYNGMLIYLVLCAGLMVFTGYITSVNILKGFQSQRERKALVKAVTSVSDFSKTFYKKPDEVYTRMERYSSDLATLQSALKARSHFLPVLSHIVAESPNVALQALNASAGDKTISFELLLPLSDVESGDPARKLQLNWKDNDELMSRIISIHPTTSERRVVSGNPVQFVQFECVLK